LDHHGAAAPAGCGTAAASGWGRTGCGRGRCGPTAWSVAAVVRVVAAPAVAEPMGEPAALVEAPATRHAGPAGRPWAAPAWDLGPAAPSCRSASCRRSTRLPHPVTIRSQPERTLRPTVSVQYRRTHPQPATPEEINILRLAWSDTAAEMRTSRWINPAVLWMTSIFTSSPTASATFPRRWRSRQPHGGRSRRWPSYAAA